MTEGADSIPQRAASEASEWPPWMQVDGDLVAVGGDLGPERLLAMYRRGVFPWYESGQPILWWCPDPRAVLEPGALHVSRSLRRSLRRKALEVTFDAAFARVIDGCRAQRAESGTWITPQMQRAYIRLHEFGHAHSVEVWQGAELVGGIYGVAVGGLFAGESMFHRVADASKIALVRLAERLEARGFTLFDLQVLNEFTASMGGSEIRRDEYLERLDRALRVEARF